LVGCFTLLFIAVYYVYVCWLHLPHVVVVTFTFVIYLHIYTFAVALVVYVYVVYWLVVTRTTHLYIYHAVAVGVTLRLFYRTHFTRCRILRCLFTTHARVPLRWLHAPLPRVYVAVGYARYVTRFCYVTLRLVTFAVHHGYGCHCGYVCYVYVTFGFVALRGCCYTLPRWLHTFAVYRYVVCALVVRVYVRTFTTVGFTRFVRTFPTHCVYVYGLHLVTLHAFALHVYRLLLFTVYVRRFVVIYVGFTTFVCCYLTRLHLPVAGTWTFVTFGYARLRLRTVDVTFTVCRFTTLVTYDVTFCCLVTLHTVVRCTRVYTFAFGLTFVTLRCRLLRILHVVYVTVTFTRCVWLLRCVRLHVFTLHGFVTGCSFTFTRLLRLRYVWLLVTVLRLHTFVLPFCYVYFVYTFTRLHGSFVYRLRTFAFTHTRFRLRLVAYPHARYIWLLCLDVTHTFTFCTGYVSPFGCILRSCVVRCYGLHFVLARCGSVTTRLLRLLPHGCGSTRYRLFTYGCGYTLCYVVTFACRVYVYVLPHFGSPFRTHTHFAHVYTVYVYAFGCICRLYVPHCWFVLTYMGTVYV